MSWSSIHSCSRGVYNNNRRSVLAIILLHFSINLMSRVLVMPAAIITANSFILIAVLALALWRYSSKRLVRESRTAS